jgi:hypothetical protein
MDAGEGHRQGNAPNDDSGWLDIAPYNFFARWLSCAGEGDHGWFCDPRLDRAMRYPRSLDAAIRGPLPRSGPPSTAMSSTEPRGYLWSIPA